MGWGRQMLTDEERASLHEVLQQIRVDEEHKASVDLRERAAALDHDGSRLVKLPPGVPLRMR
jgi:hypothetical protein